MALTISFDGTGIVAYADGETTDTGGGSWGELGAGSVGDNPDVYLYGNNSYGSQYASKAGRTYYQDNGTIDYSTTPGELIYALVNIQSNGAFRSYGTGTFNGSFNLIAGSSTANLYHWNIASKGASNGWTGGWKCLVLDPNITTGTESEGTPNLAAINTYGVWIDTDVSVRADSIFLDMIISAKGAIVTGSPTVSGEAFDELATWCTDYTNRAFGLIEVRGETYFQKGGITVGNGSTLTVFSAIGNNVECEESSFYNGSAWISSYPSDANYIVTTANASIDFENVNYAGYVDNKLEIDISIGNASSVVGGSLKLLRALSVKSTDTFDGTVFQDNDALSLGTASYDNCSFISCGSQTITAAITSFTGNVFKPATGVTALLTTDLDNFSSCNFQSGGTGHAIDLGTGITTQSMTWNSTHSGYAATDGSTGNEVIKVAVADNNTLTINVTGGDTPTIYNASTGNGAVIVSQSVSVTVTVTESDGTAIEGAAVYLKTSGGTVVLNGLTNASGVISGSYGGTTPATIDTSVSGVKHGSGVIPFDYFTLGGQIESTGYNATALLSEE